MVKRLFILFVLLSSLSSVQLVHAEDYGLYYVKAGLVKPETTKTVQGIHRSDRLYLELARRANKPGLRNKLRALYFYGKAVYDYVKSAYGALNILVLAALSFVGALCFSLFVLSLSRLLRDAPLFVHEIAESPLKLIYIAPLVLGIFDVRFMLLGFLFLVSLHLTDRQRVRLIVLMAITVVSFFLYDYVNVVIRVKNSLPSRAIELVNANKSNVPAIGAFNNSMLFEEGFSKGLALLKEKKSQRAKEVYRALSERFNDPRIHVNLGYLYAVNGQTKQAEQSFNRALDHTEIASAYYNLSILSSERLDFKQADEYFLKAVKLDFQRVTGFREKNRDSSGPHYMYDQLTNEEVFRYILKRTISKFLPRKSTLYSTVFLVLLVVLILLFAKRYKHRAIGCPKCGKIHCIRCERHIYWNGLCGSCYSALVSFQAEPSERIKVILRTYDYSRRRRMLKGIFSFFIPGFLLSQGERMMRGFYHCFLFSLLLVVGILSILFEPLYLKGIHLWITYPALTLAVLIYVYSSIYTFKRVRKGWL